MTQTNSYTTNLAVCAALTDEALADRLIRISQSPRAFERVVRDSLCIEAAWRLDPKRRVTHERVIAELTVPDVATAEAKNAATIANEVLDLDDAQRALYDEATRCGASHNDAMEAAKTYGYTR